MRHFAPISHLKTYVASIFHVGSFVLLLVLYMGAKVMERLARLPVLSLLARSPLARGLEAVYGRAVKILSLRKSGSISRINLIELSLRNMKAKRTRTIVTIGGMTIGIGTIVFLVSLGYGLQELVINRVARLEEMRQTDVVTQTGGKVKITDETLNQFSDIPEVEMSLPLIAVVGRVNYQNSATDMAVYGVTTDYLEQSAIKPIYGQVFESNELTSQLGRIQERARPVYIESTEGEFGEVIQDVEYSIGAGEWLRVRESASASARLLGYTKRVEGKVQGEEVWGGRYSAENGAGTAGTSSGGTVLGKWIRAPMLLWKQQTCDPTTEGDCEDGSYMVLRDEDGKQVQETGYIAELSLTITGADGSVDSSPSIGPSLLMGTSAASNASASAGVVAASSDIEWIEVASESAIAQVPDTKTVALATTAKRQAVVNRAMLKVLAIPESEAVGKQFTASFVVVSDLLADSSEKVESAPAEYTIVGVTPDEKSPVFYVPFMDLRSLGVTNYSQVKVVVDDPGDLAKTRRQIEAMGYVTRSVADTVAQITSLFATARTFLALLGMVALAVAALGMFNTLTVSLLERTREVGLMKAMGMKASEVQELFLTESMIMGFFGGVLGIILGFILGKILGLGLSLFAIIGGVGVIDVSYIPPMLIVVVGFLSLLVGIVTGIYPAKRATKISALNALRYE